MLRIFLGHIRYSLQTSFNIVQKALMGLLLGWFFWQLGTKDETAARNRVGLMFWICLNTTITMNAILAIFPECKPRVNK